MHMKLVTIMLTLGLVSVLVLIVSVAFMFWKDRTYHQSEPYHRESDQPADVLVLYYSRSGNTEAMAREIARTFQADIRYLDAEAYSLDYQGWRNAVGDASRHTESEIAPETVDITPYKLIFIGSPIWLFRPAPPLWTFVEHTDFQGKPVVLFNTFNSRFKHGELAEFHAAVEKSNGRFLDHIYVRRGRIIWQKSGKILIRDTRKLLDARKSVWQQILQPSVD